MNTIPQRIEELDSQSNREISIIMEQSRTLYVPFGHDRYEVPPKNYQCTAEQAKDTILEYHDSKSNIDDIELDLALLGVPVLAAEIAVRGIKNQTQIGKQKQDRRKIKQAATTQLSEQLWLGGYAGVWTPYSDIRTLLQELDLNSQDTLYDLGAGYCRLPLYTGLVTSAACKGIEMVSERTFIAQKSRDHLALNNVDIIEENVRNYDYGDGNVFYMYSPFSKETALIVLSQLKDIASRKPIRLAIRGCDNTYDQQHWLRLVKDFYPDDDSKMPLKIFEASPE